MASQTDLRNLTKELKQAGNKEKGLFLQRFFKTGKGQYGEGDIFLGLTVPMQRLLVRKYKNLSLDDVSELLKSPYHEFRLTGLMILVEQMKVAKKIDDTTKAKKVSKAIYSFYLNHSKCVNNWDLVDSSARDIVGGFLYDFGEDRSVLYKLVRSKYMWERRIAIVATFYFIKKGEYDDTLRLSELLLNDTHDLIHKAVGWMLREMGKMDEDVLKKFLDIHAHAMPRTMLRYAIERLSPHERVEYMNMKYM